MPNSDDDKDKDFKGPNAKNLVGKLFRRNTTRNYKPVSVSANNSPDRQLGAGANVETEPQVSYSRRTQSCDFINSLPYYKSTEQLAESSSTGSDEDSLKSATDEVEFVTGNISEDQFGSGIVSDSQAVDSDDESQAVDSGDENQSFFGSDLEPETLDRTANWSVTSGSAVISETSSEAEAEPVSRNMGDLAALKEALQDIANSNKKNDVRLLSELPYFGESGDTTGKLWILDSASEFTELVEKATAAETWTDTGRISVLRSKLLGSARAYFNSFTGATFKEAKEFLLELYPDNATYSSIMSEIYKFKRQKGESLNVLAIRISELYKKLGKVQGNNLTEDAIERMKIELLLRSVPGSARNFVDLEKDKYPVVLKKLLNYFEQNVQHKLTVADIKAETESGVKGVNAVTKENKNQNQNQNKNQKQNQDREQNDGTVAAIAQKDRNVGNKVQNENSQKGNQNTTRSSEYKQGNKSFGNKGSNGYGGGRGQGYRSSRNQYYGRNQNQYYGQNQGQGYGRGYSRGNMRGYGRGYGRTSNKHYGLQCYKCDKFNHIASNCRSEERTTEGARDAGNDVVICYKCKKPNHYAANCLQQGSQSQGF